MTCYCCDWPAVLSLFGKSGTSTELLLELSFLFFFSIVFINLTLAGIAFQAISTFVNLLLLGSYGTVSVGSHLVIYSFVRLRSFFSFASLCAY